MEQSPSREATRFSASEKDSQHFMEPEGLLPRLKLPSPVPILSLISPVHAPQPTS